MSGFIFVGEKPRGGKSRLEGAKKRCKGRILARRKHNRQIGAKRLLTTDSGWIASRPGACLFGAVLPGGGFSQGK